MRHLVCLTAVAVLVACAPPVPSAADLLPIVPTADIVEGQTLIQYHRSRPAGAVDLQVHPAEAQLLQLIDDVYACYQNVGGTAMRRYADKRLPLMSGFIVIANRRDLDNTTQFNGCLAQAAQSPMLQPTFALCSYSYTMPRGDAQFEVAYLALSQTMCKAFCARLSGCTTQR